MSVISVLFFSAAGVSRGDPALPLSSPPPPNTVCTNVIFCGEINRIDLVNTMASCVDLLASLFVKPLMSLRNALSCLSLYCNREYYYTHSNRILLGVDKKYFHIYLIGRHLPGCSLLSFPEIFLTLSNLLYLYSTSDVFWCIPKLCVFSRTSKVSILRK